MEYKQIEEWEDNELEALVKFKKTKVYGLLKYMFEGEAAQLKEDALLGQPSEKPREDSWQMGFRKGKFTGMENLLHTCDEAEEILNKRNVDNKDS